MKKVLFCLICTGMLFANSLQEILDTGEIRVGVRKDFPPLSSLKDNELVGFEVDLAKKIFSEIFKDKNITIKFVGTTSKDRISLLDENKIDVSFSSMAQTPQRMKQVDFTMPYLTTNMAIVSNKNKKISRLSDFKNKTLFIIPKTTSDEYIKKNPNDFMNINIKFCDGLMNCFERLKNGEADGYFHSILSIGVLPILDPNYEVSVGLIGRSDLVAAGVKKGNKELLQLINDKIIDIAQTSFFKDAYHDSFDVYYKGTLNKKYFLLDDLYLRFL